LASLDRVKGTDAASLAAALDERITTDAERRADLMSHRDATREAIDVHRAAGRRFAAGATTSFVREQGEGTPVVLLHGIPSSSFLYRKVIPLLAEQGLRGVAFDFPGLGLADRPTDLDYSWSGLARWTGEAIDALGIDRCHLVVHDIGGPIGCEWAIRNPDRALSLTALNTMLNVATFRRHWTMAPFAVRGLGPLMLRSMSRWLNSTLFYRYGIADRSAVPRHEAFAYTDLLKREDGGKAFLRIVRGFELTEAKQRFLWEGLAERPYPARLVWGERDPVLDLEHLRIVQRVLRAENPILLPAKHFLQEDQATAVAQSIADLAAPLG
jgi:pimeloyl-ACP methyl ester carboxylesterase